MNEEKKCESTFRVGCAKRRYEPISRDHARRLVELMVKEFQPSSFRPGGATWAGLMKKSGMKESTYQRALAWCTEHEWLVGGGGRNLKYNLNSDGNWKAAFESPQSSSSPSMEANWGLVGGDSKVDSHLALISEAIQDVDEKKH